MTPFSKQISKSILAEASVWHSEFAASPKNQHSAHEFAAPAPSEEKSREVFCIFDACGCARFCSDPHVFAKNSNDTRQLSLCELLPGLPLRPTTPGYNIAYVRLNFPHNIWQTHTVHTASAGQQQAELCLKPVPLGRGYCLLGRFRLNGKNALAPIPAGKVWPSLWQNIPTAPETNRLVSSANIRHAA